MRVLVTGAAGFIGNAVLKALSGDHEAIGLDVRAGGGGARWIVGDLSEPETMDRVQEVRPDALIHLATVPGGAAESNPAHAWRINIETTQRLLEILALNKPELRAVFASSIAALGRLDGPVDDGTLLRPHMLYGAHKLIMENWLAALSRRGDVTAVSLRLPGIVARPRAPSGMKSAFMSDLFHSALAKEQFVSPVGNDATMWLMSVKRTAENLVHALEARVSEPFAFTLPAVRTTMGNLVNEIARQTNFDVGSVIYRPDEAIEADFGRYPELRAARAELLGFIADKDLQSLVASALSTLKDSI